MMAEDNIQFEKQESVMEKTINRLLILYRRKIDRYIIYPRARWALMAFLLFLYILRVSIIGGFYVVSYILGLYLLHLMVQFLTPQGMPDIDDEDDDEEDKVIVGDLPTFGQENTEERGPLIRSMNEFKFWQSCTLSCFIALLCTFSQVFDLPVFWPFLLAYFIMLCFLTIKRQLKHMQKHNYSFLDFTRKVDK